MSSIIFQKSDHCAKLILNRPPLNLMNLDMMTEIGDALETLHREDHIKLIVVASNCKLFSAGIDMVDHTAQKVFYLLESFHRIFLTMVELGKPTLAVVNGPALGGGCELAAFCDLVIASENAKFGQPEVRVGVFPPVASVVFPYLVGKKKAMELLLLGDPIDAQEALSLGLVNRIVPHGLNAFTDWLNDRGVRNIKALNSILKGAHPWYAKYGGLDKIQPVNKAG